MTVLDLDDDHYGDLRPILADDLAAFVRADDRHRSLTVVREVGERDVIAAARQWWDQVRADPGSVDACTAVRRAVDKWADGSRGGQLRGVLAVVRLDERGHRGVAAALDELWGVRAKDSRDFARLVEFARSQVITDPSPTAAIGCRCDGVTLTPITMAVAPTRAQLVGLLRSVLDADPAEQPGRLAWAVGKLTAWAAAGVLDPVYVRNVTAQLTDACGAR